MKVHYKSVLLNPDRKPSDKEMWHSSVLRKKNNEYLIDYCCEAMKSALDKYTEVFDVTGHEFYLYDVSGDYDSTHSTFYFHRVDFCPFCGDKVEYIEDYKAKEVMYKARIQAKHIPARTETRSKEVKI